MDCKTARMFLEFDRPRSSELAGDEAEALRDHLGDCPDCRDISRAERKADEVLGRAMRSVPVPEEARARLLRRLDRERASWYRRRVLGPAVALAAACLALAFWLGWERDKAKVRPNLDDFVAGLDIKRLSPAEQVQAWFHDTYHVRTLAPDDFDYRCLFDYDLADFQGKRVPRLQFLRDGETAQVYILSDSQFDLSNLSAPPGYNIQVLHHPTNPHFVYVAVYSKDLERFLKRDVDGRT